jgi:DNA-directed RNA polymerase subunit RPC12/RpoP
MESKKLVRCPNCKSVEVVLCAHPICRVRLLGRWYRCTRCMSEFSMEESNEKVPAIAKR